MEPSPSPAADDSAFPRSGRLAGVDFGTVRIGVSICDPMWILVSPLEIRAVTDPDRDAAYFRELARREHVEGWVVGLPIHCDGKESQKSVEARKFAVWLHAATSIPVRLFDERFTTSAAEDRVRSARNPGGKTGSRKGGMKRSRERLVDAVAAQVLLESFIEAARYHDTLPGQSPASPATGETAID
jgi:putative Holliday junction resolvase